MTSKTCAWRFGNQPLEVARKAHAVVFHAPHAERFGWGIDAWSKCLGSAGKPAQQTWTMLTMESKANVPYDALLPHIDAVFSHNMHTSPVPSPQHLTLQPLFLRRMMLLRYPRCTPTGCGGSGWANGLLRCALSAICRVECINTLFCIVVVQCDCA